VVSGAPLPHAVIVYTREILRRMTTDALDSEYENGVADVLGYLAGDAAAVERNVRMLGKKSGVSRQIDVKVTGALFGTENATMMVDCKRYSKKVSVERIDQFVGFVEDVGAEVGLLVSTIGMTPAAQQYAENVRGIRLATMTLDELAKWSPVGTEKYVYAVPVKRYLNTVRKVRRAGFRVREIPLAPSSEDVLAFEAFRYNGGGSNEARSKRRKVFEKKLAVAFREAGVKEPQRLSFSVIAHGGTPAYRQLQVTVDGSPIDDTLLVSSEEEIAGFLDAEAFRLEVARERLDVIRPEIWPVPSIFPTSGSGGGSNKDESGPYIVMHATGDGYVDMFFSNGYRTRLRNLLEEVPDGAES
jgi:hypothetical protein